MKKIVGYLLPIATSRIPVRSPLTGFLYRSLRRLAWLRLRLGWWWGGLDERLYGWILGRTLSQTYRP